LAAKANEWTGT